MMILVFTIHFATINTTFHNSVIILLLLFTIHFATINTCNGLFRISNFLGFTIHFATINTISSIFQNCFCSNLQYTLLLLIHLCG